MEHNGFYFADRTGATEPTKPDLLPAATIPKEAIEAEVERLASLPAPANGRRASIIANPLTGPGEGLSPGIDVCLSVLKPGERTTPIRHNASQVNFCIRGAGESTIDGKVIKFGHCTPISLRRRCSATTSGGTVSTPTREPSMLSCNTAANRKSRSDGCPRKSCSRMK